MLHLSTGRFNYWDRGRGRMTGDRRLECLMTIRAGQIVYDREGLSTRDWREHGPND